MRTLHRAFSTLLVATTVLVGIAAATGCETDDSSSPLPPATKDATADHAAEDGAAAAPDGGASTSEAATDAASDGPASDAAGQTGG